VFLCRIINKRVLALIVSILINIKQEIMKKQKQWTVVLLGGLLLSSCVQDEQDLGGDTIARSSIGGVVQKGPFINGSSISMYELSDALVPSGKTYNGQISDNQGSFELKYDPALSSNYVKVRADGYYYNEVSGQNSNSQLTLYALSDISDKSSINVNIMSYLEYQRVEYLVSQGESFANAKSRAEAEILKVFSMTRENIQVSESLNILKDGDDNAVLLAISAILQGFRSEANMTNLLANIITDLKKDGTLDDANLGTQLITDAKLLDLAAIRKNLEERFASDSTVIPNFEKYVRQFISKTPFKPISIIDYPQTTSYGANILSGDADPFVVSISNEYSFAANVSKGGSLKIVMKGGSWSYSVMPFPPINWDITMYDNAKQEQTFTVTESGKNSNLKIFFHSGKPVIEYYENNSLVATKTQHILIKDGPPIIVDDSTSVR
jgi:hypothetical protein